MIYWNLWFQKVLIGIFFRYKSKKIFIGIIYLVPQENSVNVKKSHNRKSSKILSLIIKIQNSLV